MTLGSTIKTSLNLSNTLIVPFIAVLLLSGCQGGGEDGSSTSISYKTSDTQINTDDENAMDTNTDATDMETATTQGVNESCLEEVYSDGSKINACVACHVDGGLADVTALTFKTSDTQYNYTALKSYLEVDTKHSNTLIDKISHTSSVSHFGGKFSINDVAYFQNYVDAFENQDSCTLGEENNNDMNTDNSNTTVDVTYDLSQHRFQSQHSSSNCLVATSFPGALSYAKCNEETNSLWKKDSLGRFHNAQNPEYCLNAREHKNFAEVNVATCNKTSITQRWTYTQDIISNGKWTIDLDVQNQKPLIYAYHGGVNQKWKEASISDGTQTDTNTNIDTTDTETNTDTDTNMDTSNASDKEACMKEIYEKKAEVTECVACHSSTGPAKNTSLVFGNNEYESLKNFLDASSLNGQSILDKITKDSGTSHFGGKYSSAEVGFYNEFIQAHSNQDSCLMDDSNTNTGNTGTENTDIDTENTDTDTENTDTNNDNTNTDTNVNTSAPTISLLGNSSISLTQGHTYVDPGYSAKDYSGKDLQVVVKGNVNTAVVGNYKLLYTATDSKGKVSSMTRTIKVLAKQTYEYFVDVRGQISANQSVIAPDDNIYKCKIAGWCNLINPNDDAYVPGEGRAWRDAWDFVSEGEKPVESKLPTAPNLVALEYNYETSSLEVSWSALSENTQKVQVLVNSVQKKEIFGYLLTSSTIEGDYKVGQSYTVSLIAINAEGESLSNEMSIRPVSPLDKGREYYNRDCKVCHGTNGTNKADLTKWDKIIPFSNWTHDSKMPASYTASCNDQCLETVGIYVKDILIPRSNNTTTDISQDVVSDIPRGYRLLNSVEYKNTLESLFLKEVDSSTLPLDNLVGGYNSDRNLNRVDEDKVKYFNEMSRLYENYIDNLKGGSKNCNMGGYDFCKADKNQFLNSFATNIFRRPLTQGEKNEFSQLGSIGEIVGDMIASPKFLYRSEMGVKTSTQNVYQLTQYEIATAIAYAMSGTTPDAELLSLAGSNRLSSANTRITQAVRLSKLDTGKRRLEDFIGRWLLHDDVNSLGDKNPDRFPGYNQKVRDAQSKQIAEFFKMVIGDLKNSTYSDLLINDKWVTNKTLSSFYNEGTSNSSEFEIISSTSKRFGVLTLGAVASKYANSEEGHPFKRGDFILSRMMCHEMGLPGNGGDVASIQNNIGKNTRDRYAQHSNDQSCVSCHELLDPIGFLWEKYDGSGKFREKEWHPDSEGGSKPIDISVTLKGVLSFSNEESVPANDMRDLSELIANSDRGPECMAMQYYRYVSGESLSILENNEVVQKIASDFKNEGYDLQSLFNNIVGLRSFITRKGN